MKDRCIKSISLFLGVYSPYTAWGLTLGAVGMDLLSHNHLNSTQGLNIPRVVPREQEGPFDPGRQRNNCYIIHTYLWSN